ncbi:unnamed protein product [Caenorhabditis angaria]|uniref:Peptidase S54 rhomboid domain-containing protein n=1 Tax=Caenorhabditis angaria TaxID=860376 RepID=A0A9P1IGG9_9PELO|nr:unnamed protein product [Caenorhabditis angaria]
MTSTREWLTKVKKSMTNLVLTADQQRDSANNNPYFMILAFIVPIFSTKYLILNYIAHDFYTKYDADFIIANYVANIMEVLRSFIPHIFIGIPLEISNGPLQTSIFYIFGLVYPNIIGSVLNDYQDYHCETAGQALIGLHFANIVKNWPTFSYKKTRIIGLFILLVTTESIQNVLFYDVGTLRFVLYHTTCGIAGVLFGFLAGYYWIYRQQKEDGPTTKWRSSAISLTLLTAYLILAEFSGLHMTDEEWHQQLANHPEFGGFFPIIV